jgi:hypothetical protein
MRQCLLSSGHLTNHAFANKHRDMTAQPEPAPVAAQVDEAEVRELDEDSIWEWLRKWSTEYGLLTIAGWSKNSLVKMLVDFARSQQSGNQLAPSGQSEREFDLGIMLAYTLKGRCPCCGWPIANSANEGCVIDNCSFRPQDSPFQETWRRRAKIVHALLSEDKIPPATPTQAQDSAAMVAGAYLAANAVVWKHNVPIAQLDSAWLAGNISNRILALTPSDALAALESVKREARLEEAEWWYHTLMEIDASEPFYERESKERITALRAAAIRAHGGSR